ncbi:MAG TPA: hypothetical protein VLK32_02455 [Bacillota bacterium]|nr:hypothetical protein [Bacillota bacterium]
MRYVGDGFAIALRRWPTLVPLTGMIAVACVVLSLILSNALVEVAGLRGARLLHERRAVAFSAYYQHGAASRVGDDTVRYLAEMIDRRAAYTAVLGDMLGPGELDFPAWPEAIVLFGDAVSDLFPELQPGEPTPLPFALRGARFAGQNADALNLAGERVPIVGTLPPGATFFDMGRGVISLDHRIVIRAPVRMLPLLAPIARQEALLRAVMFAPAGEVVNAYVSGCAQGGLFLVPFPAIEYLQRHRESLPFYAMHGGAMLSLVALAFAALMASARSAMRQELGTLRVRETVGAKGLQVGLRIGGFLAAVVLVPVAFLSLFALASAQVVPGTPGAQGVPWVFSALLLACLCMWFALMRDARLQGQVGRSA